MRWTKYFVGESSFEISKWVFDQFEIWDAHTHIGADKDGTIFSLKGLTESMEDARINKAVVFPLNDPKDQSFSKPNDEIFNAYKKHPRKVIPFFRLNPKMKWKDEFKKRVRQGFMGIKLHPKSQKFSLTQSAAMDIYAEAEKEDLPVLIHTGYGLEAISPELEKIIRSFPKLRLILGHAAFIDMDSTIMKLSKSNYVFFETSTVTVFDLYNLIDKVDRNGIIFGSDMPYVSSEFSLEAMIHVASILNIPMKDLGKILSENIQRWF